MSGTKLWVIFVINPIKISAFGLFKCKQKLEQFDVVILEAVAPRCSVKEAVL